MELDLSLGVYESFSKRCCEGWDIYSRDGEGVLQVDYGMNIEIQYNPVTIEQYALVYYNTYKNERR